MPIKKLLITTGLVLAMASPAMAEETKEEKRAEMQQEHGGEIMHMFRLETDYGTTRDGGVGNWDGEGWIGTDENKLWLKTEGEYADGKIKEGEAWALYSRNIATFWDAQAGIRQDFGASPNTYATFGFTGLAPYYFETEAHLFVSKDGDVTARFRQENDVLLTQKLIVQPYVEVNLSAQDVPEMDMGAGIVDGKVGLQTRYEFTRKFAPYVDVSYGRKFGETASIAGNNGEDKDELVGSVGLRLMF